MQSNNKQPKASQHLKQNASSDNLKLVTVYFRLSTKIGVKMIVPNQMTVREISLMAEAELKIETKYQIIYFASRKYESDWPVILDLEEGSIIHIHDKRSMGLGKIKISIQEIKGEGQQTKPIEFSVNSDLKIHQFIQLHLERENVLLAESGRWLDLNRTFRQENVENQATIYCISKCKQLDHDEFEKDFNNLFQDQQESQNQKPTNQQTFSKVKEERQKRLECRRTKKQQMSSSSEIQTPQPRFDFKKKKSSICLKAVKKNPEDIGYTWKIDRSSSSSKSSKKLARALKGKRKNKKQVSNNEQDTENERMSLNAKLKLRQQIKKLFMSQNLGLKAANKNKQSLTSSGEISSSKEVESKQNILFEQCQQSQAVF